MRESRRRRKGFALLAVIVFCGVLGVLLGVLTAHLAGLTRRTSHYAWSVRSRALAEAGIEVFFARTSAPQKRVPDRLDIQLDGGSCTVTTRPLAGNPDRLNVTSEGQLPLAGGHMTTRVRLVVETGPDGRPRRILSREEQTHFVPAKPTESAG